MTMQERLPEAKGRRVEPANFLRRVERPSNLAALEQLTPHLAEAARDLADLFDKHPWMTAGFIHIIGDAALEGVVALQRNPDTKDTDIPPAQAIEVFIEGELGRNIPKVPKGDPFAALEDAEGVFFQSSANKPPYAKTGDIVQKDRPVLWVMVSKNVQFALQAPITGKITYVVENGQKIKGKQIVTEDGKEVEVPGDILFYIEEINE